MQYVSMGVEMSAGASGGKRDKGHSSSNIISKLEPVWLSVKIAAYLTSMSEAWIDKEVVKKRAIPVYKDTESDSQRGSVRFLASDFWDWWNKRFGVSESGEPRSA